jgi:[ribosomal protein S18]-alanine N-acetyltransferase
MSDRTVRTLVSSDATALANFFERLSADPETRRFFHPHALDKGSAQRIANYRGPDVYLGCFEDGHMIGYAMLRGWEEGFKVPALGVATDPHRRREGIGRALVHHTLRLAAQRGASKVLLHVHADHVVARRWYEAEGFRERESSLDRQLTYWIDLPRSSDHS